MITTTINTSTPTIKDTVAATGSLVCTAGLNNTNTLMITLLLLEMLHSPAVKATDVLDRLNQTMLNSQAQVVPTRMVVACQIHLVVPLLDSDNRNMVFTVEVRILPSQQDQAHLFKETDLDLQHKQ